ncbi:hypothetical protein ACSLOL_28820, partial [Escherichia coli]
NNCDTTEAALLAADVLGIDYRTTETPEATSQKREQLETERQQQRSIGQHGECKITYPFRNQIIRFAVYSLSAHVIKLTGKR